MRTLFIFLLLLCIFFVPLFYIFIRKITCFLIKKRKKVIFYLRNDELNIKNGGNIVVMKTVELFNKNNIDCYLYSKKTNKIVNDRYHLPLTNKVDNNSIVIYKDGTYGNPLKTNNVCRWMLYYPEKRGGKKLTDTWSKNDVLISYGSFTGNMDCKLDIDTVDFYEDIFKFLNKTLNRKKKFYTIHKAKLQEWTQDDLDNQINSLKLLGFEELTQKRSQEDLKSALNEASIFISFDVNTYISNIAVLCGSLSIIKKSPLNTLSYEELFKKRGPYGTIGLKKYEEDLLYKKYNLKEREHESNQYRKYIENKNNDTTKIDKFKKYFNL